MDKLYSFPITSEEGLDLMQTIHEAPFNPKTQHINDEFISLPTTYDTITPEGSRRTTVQEMAFYAQQLIQVDEQGAALGGMLLMKSSDGKTASGRRVVLSIDSRTADSPIVVASPNYASALQRAREDR